MSVWPIGSNERKSMVQYIVIGIIALGLLLYLGYFLLYPERL